MYMEDNRKRFLDKILKWMVDGTEVHPYVRTWFPTFLDMEDYSITLRPLDISVLSLFPTVRFYDYCRNTYDLSVEEIEYLWSKYSTIIIDKFNNEKPLNESEDNRKRFLDKILNWLVNDTKIDYENKSWYPTFMDTSLMMYKVTFMVRDTLYYHNPLTLFYDYCVSTYDLNDKEIVYLWNVYRNIIIEKLNTEKSINESEDKLDRYFNYVIDDLVKRTKHWTNPSNIDHIGNVDHIGIIFPMYVGETEYYYTEDELKEWLHGGWLVGSEDIKYLMDQYGLTEDECSRVMDMFGIKLATLLISEYGEK